MIRIAILFTVVSASVYPNLDHIRPSASLNDQRQAALDLIARIIGPKSNTFQVDIIKNKDPEFHDTFNLMSDGKNVTITATSGVAAAMGFYYFLKTKCRCQFTWGGEQLNLPSPLPVIPKPGLSITTNDRFRYYENVCTFSYTFVWWDWSKWQRHIDWMAMNGINLPLAFTGQEAIFQRVYKKLGFTDEDLGHHFAGPAFLAWARMGNMEGWGGPLPQSWIDDQLVLQHQILGRMRELGMIPVLPGFAGHVPKAITRLYPKVKYSQLDNWGRFNKTYCCTYLLDFHEPLFQKIGSAFIKEMEAEFGVDHVYNGDTFNEMVPVSNDTDYIKSAGQSVYSAMTSADPKAVWLMQGLLFLSEPQFWHQEQIKALLTSVPQGRMIVLDLEAARIAAYNLTRSFYGQPFIWCMLNNYGGTMRLYGNIDTLNEGPFTARNIPGSSMVGIGLTPEGLYQNEAMYEFMNENAFVKTPRNLTVWFTDFTQNRYGKYNTDADMAWQLLKTSVFNSTDSMPDDNSYVVPTSRPDINLKLPEIWYDTVQLFNAWGHMVEASKFLNLSALFRYDLVDVARNSLQDISTLYYTEVIAAYKERNYYRLERSGEALLVLFDDMETLLRSDKHFLLGPWLRDARTHGHTMAEKNLMEYNARNQITLWGPNGEVREYAAKQWSGLMLKYYEARYYYFIKELLQCIEKRKAFNQTAYNEEMFNKVEQPFTFDTSPFPVVPTGDPVKIASDLYQKYLPVMQSDFFKHLKVWSRQGQRLYAKQAQHWVIRQTDSASVKTNQSL